MPFRILVTGSRDWQHPEVASFILSAEFVRHPDALLIHGAAPGLDVQARDIALACGGKQKGFRANWKEHGKNAGIIRNQKMVNYGADVCYGFPIDPPGGRGTRDCMKRAHAARIPVWVVTESGVLYQYEEWLRNDTARLPQMQITSV